MIRVRSLLKRDGFNASYRHRREAFRKTAITIRSQSRIQAAHCIPMRRISVTIALARLITDGCMSSTRQRYAREPADSRQTVLCPPSYISILVTQCFGPSRACRFQSPVPRSPVPRSAIITASQRSHGSCRIHVYIARVFSMLRLTSTVAPHPNLDHLAHHTFRSPKHRVIHLKGVVLWRYLMRVKRGNERKLLQDVSLHSRHAVEEEEGKDACHCAETARQVRPGVCVSVDQRCDIGRRLGCSGG